MSKKEIKNSNVANIILLNKNNEVLIQKKDLGYKWFPGRWCLPGGTIEQGETPEQCLKREMKEEYSLFKMNDLEFFICQDYLVTDPEGTIKRGKQHTYISHFHGKISDLRIGEGAGFAFFAESELDSIPVAKYDIAILKKYFSRNSA